MSSTRLHPHSSLPAPVVHAGFSVSQSKSHVLAGVQDAYWSDDEAVSIFLSATILDCFTISIISRMMQNALFV